MNPPTADDPLIVACTECDGDPDCASCSGLGRCELAGCPYQFVTSDVWRAIEAWQRSKNGVWPLAGGWLDQTAKGLRAIEFIGAEERLAGNVQEEQ